MSGQPVFFCGRGSHCGSTTGRGHRTPRMGVGGYWHLTGTGDRNTTTLWKTASRVAQGLVQSKRGSGKRCYFCIFHHPGVWKWGRVGCGAASAHAARGPRVSVQSSQHQRAGGPGPGTSSYPQPPRLETAVVLLCVFPVPLDFHPPCCSLSCGGGSRPPASAFHVPLRSLSLEQYTATVREPGRRLCWQEPQGVCQAGSDRAEAPGRWNADAGVYCSEAAAQTLGAGPSEWQGHLRWL